MMALLDLGLFIIDVTLWNEDRSKCTLPIEAMLVHAPHLRRHPIQLLWSDDFFAGFPWNQPRCPPELRDVCTVLQSTYELLKSHQRIVTLENVSEVNDDVVFDPYPLRGAFPEDACLAWKWLLAWAVTDGRTRDGLGVPSWRSDSGDEAKQIQVFPRSDSSVEIGRAERLLDDDDWQSFVQKYQQPDLRGRRVAVLGGSRASFERARKTLESYGINPKDVRRLPPAYEETRTKQETLERLKTTELLLVCTNRCKHTDTDHISGDLNCARIDLNSDGEKSLVDAVLGFFRNR